MSVETGSLDPIGGSPRLVCNVVARSTRAWTRVSCFQSSNFPRLLSVLDGSSGSKSS